MSILRTKIILIKIVFDFKEITNSVYYINSGGCGLFAEYAYEMFARLGFNPALAIISREHCY